MNQAYSNKALPAGTVLREWELEEVLGVGGFGIVYKGRGIYFDELVAIKEYFPSAISERKEGDTVVPIDSQAEEVHALGLKKFVEEAKLLWNLSTPTRHPNIVSVRSLFEIHGTAYMVMDFEDGMSLSKMLKDGQRFNQASLEKLIKPIAQGLERAHRVGVLHRDIKPPNILITEDSRPVLIDFGSARFESGDATSTKVTFHTPPYAAIEQYVKTYDQGPWTDIYALGVVLYECITGTKPPEVLERMHGGDSEALSAGEWPGFSKQFLAAVDAALMIKPSDRPQSISDWLALFDAEPSAAKPPVASDFDDDATRVEAFVSDPEEIKPVGTQATGSKAVEKPVTPVPTSTEEAIFKGPGQNTNAGKKHKHVDDIARPPGVKPSEEAKSGDEAEPNAKDKPKDEAGKGKTADKKSEKDAKKTDKKGSAPPKKPNKGVILAGAAAGALLLAVGGYFAFSGSGEETEVVEDAVEPIELGDIADLPAALTALAENARQANVSAAAVQALTASSSEIAEKVEALGALEDESAIAAQTTEIENDAKAAISSLVDSLSAQAATRVQRIKRDQAWADPDRPNAANGEPAARQRIARNLRSGRTTLASEIEAAKGASEIGDAIGAAQRAIAGYSTFSAAYFQAMNSTPDAASDAVTETPVEAETATEEAPAAAAAAGPAGQASALFPEKFRTFNSVISSARRASGDVIRMAGGTEPGSDASNEARTNYRVRQTNANTARGYVEYLDTLVNSMRGERTEAEVDNLIASARQTERYLANLQAQSERAR